MNLYYSLLKAFLRPEIYRKYWDTIKLDDIKENHPELYRLYQTLPTLHGASPSGDGSEERTAPYTVDDLEVSFKTCYPNSPDTSYRDIFSRIAETATDPSKVEEYLEASRKRLVAKQVALAAIPVWEGNRDYSHLQEILLQVAQSETNDQSKQEDFVNDDLDDLLEHTVAESGLRWRLDSLNRNLGSLRKGDFGFLFARPETGKTTFLASEVSYMASQVDRPILWFNNEEQSRKVLLRVYQAATGKTVADIMANREEAKQLWRDAAGHNVKIVCDAVLSRRSIEKYCREINPSLIIIDQIDKITGFSDDRNDIELEAIYTWARELAKIYAPVIAVCQAGASGEGKRWLTMNDVNNSKTGKQGAADWILGIGKVLDEALQDVRYLHLSKNKLLGDRGGDESMRHGKWEVKIYPEIGRYADF